MEKSTKSVYSQILQHLPIGSERRTRSKRTSLSLGRTLEKISDDDMFMSTKEFDLDASQWKYYTWEMPKFISFDFAFYKQFFLNLENDNYVVHTLDCVIGFNRLAKLLGIAVSNETTKMLLDMQESDGTHTIKWETFASFIKSHEDRSKFVRTKQKRLGPSSLGGDNDHNGYASEKGSDALNLDAETLIMLTPLERIYFLLEGDCYTKWRYVVAMIRAAATLISVGGLVLESIPALKSAPDCAIPPCLGEPTGARIFDLLQIITLFIFMVDYLFKVFACGFVRHELMNRWDIVTMGAGRSRFVKPATFWARFFSFVLSPLALCEAAAVWPSFIRWLIVGMNDTSFQNTLIYDFFRSLRILTLLKVLKLTNLKDITYILARAMMECIGALSVLFLVLGMLVLFLSILACIPESGQWYPRGAIVPGGLISLGAYYRPSYLNPNVYEQSPFYSIPASYWWAMMNITGYGDLVPTTPWGRLIGLLIALIGLAIISLPIAIISEAFGGEYERFHGVKRMLKANRMAEVQQRLFERITRDVTAEELERKIVAETSSIADDTQSSVKNDESSSVKTGKEMEQLEPTGDKLDTVLLPQLRLFADSHEEWATVVGRVESLKVKLENQTLRNRSVYEFVNAATKLINESDMPPSPTSGARSETSKLVYEIATYFVDKLNANTNISSNSK